MAGKAADRHDTTIAGVLAGIAAGLDRSRVVTMQTTDPEGPHQLRVGLRKLRTAAGVFSGVVPALKPLGDEARWLGQEVGRLRDLDVIRMELSDRAHTGGDGMLALRELLDEAGETARHDVRAVLEGERAQALFATCHTLSANAVMVPGRPAAQLADKALRDRLAKIRKLGRKFGSLNRTQRHDFRKELKKLRYCFDCGAWPGDSKARKKFLKRLKRLQGSLGGMNDALVAREVLRRATAGRPAAMQGAAETVIDAHKLRARRQMKKAEALWARLDGTRVAH